MGGISAREMEQSVWLHTHGAKGANGDAEEVWRAAVVVAEADGECTCKTCDGGEELASTVPRAELLLREVLPLGGVADLVALGNLHGPAILVRSIPRAAHAAQRRA